MKSRALNDQSMALMKDTSADESCCGGLRYWNKGNTRMDRGFNLVSLERQSQVYGDIPNS